MVNPSRSPQRLHQLSIDVNIGDIMNHHLQVVLLLYRQNGLIDDDALIVHAYLRALEVTVVADVLRRGKVVQEMGFEV